MTTLTSFGSCSSEYEGRDKNGITHLGVSNFCARMFVPCFFLVFAFWPISANLIEMKKKLKNEKYPVNRHKIIRPI